MRVGITGSNGLIGRALSRSLLTAGHTVVPFVRDRARVSADAVWWSPATKELDEESFDNTALDAIVHLAGRALPTSVGPRLVAMRFSLPASTELRF
jgi:NAD dependent epimerase/dehydratase family enzyme